MHTHTRQTPRKARYNIVDPRLKFCRKIWGILANRGRISNPNIIHNLNNSLRHRDRPRWFLYKQTTVSLTLDA